MRMTKIGQINTALREYFEVNKSINIIPAKDMMSYFILVGVFEKDTKNGKPIREILRKLDSKNELHQIPFVYAERKDANTNWYFQRNGASASFPNKAVSVKQKTTTVSTTSIRKESDENYVLDLCDEVLGHKGSRQHRFDFLVGDPNKQGKCAKLPVDSYYPDLNLVIEYKEQQHTKPNKHFDKPDLFTVSGVHRGEQRKIYDQRRLEILPKHGISVVEISYSDFEYDAKDRILRSHRDMGMVKNILKR